MVGKFWDCGVRSLKGVRRRQESVTIEAVELRFGRYEDGGHGPGFGMVLGNDSASGRFWE